MDISLIVGPCFVHLAEEMKQAYGPYCKNHDDVITLLEKVTGFIFLSFYINFL